MKLKKLTRLPNTITIKPLSVEIRMIANREKYGKHAIELWLKKPNNKINLSTMIMIDGWAYEVLDIISFDYQPHYSTMAIVIKML